MNFKELFSKLEKEKRIAFIPFIELGYPDEKTCLEISRALVEAGADALELGIPFSEPIADGKTIQEASQKALENGMNTEKAFALIAKIRKFFSEPIGLLVYSNLAHAIGFDNFCMRAKKSGVNGILFADMPLEESKIFLPAMEKNSLDPIFLIAQSTSNERIKEISAKGKGFLYLVSVLGVTGERKEFDEKTIQFIFRAKKNSSLPICVGFGISSPEQVKQIAKAGANGAIIGSALIKNFQENKDLKKLKEFAEGLRKET